VSKPKKGDLVFIGPVSYSGATMPRGTPLIVVGSFKAIRYHVMALTPSGNVESINWAMLEAEAPTEMVASNVYMTPYKKFKASVISLWKSLGKG